MNFPLEVTLKNLNSAVTAYLQPRVFFALQVILDVYIEISRSLEIFYKHVPYGTSPPSKLTPNTP
jgi:hypothetical protein